MSVPLVIFYHCVFNIGGNHLLSSRPIVHEQMKALKDSGLEDAACAIYIGINGDKTSGIQANGLLPAKSQVTYHGEESRSENLTIVMIENYVRTFPGERYICYTHSKGATHAPGSPYGEGTSKPWRQRMTRDVVLNWRNCVAALDQGFDIACSQWVWGAADGTQHIPAGNFLWVKASFVRKLPSIFHRDRIGQSGIASLESRYEAEVYWGNGPRPNVKQFA